MNNQTFYEAATMQHPNTPQCGRKLTNSGRQLRIILLLVVFAFCLTGMALAKNNSFSSARNKKTGVVLIKNKNAKTLSFKMKNRKRASMLDKLAGIVAKFVPADAIELTRYAIKRPIHFGKVVGHGVAVDIPFFALVGAVKAAKNKNFPGIGTFTQAKCEMPITVIDVIFDKADSYVNDAKGKQDTNAVVGVAKEYAAQYAKEQSDSAKQELINKLTDSVPYFGEIKTICSFAFETNLQAEKDIQNAIGETARQFHRAYEAFDKGNYGEGVAILLTLGADANIACDFVDNAVHNGVLPRIPVLSSLANTVCKAFVGKVIDGVKGIIKGGIGYAEDGVKAIGALGKDVGCAVYSLVGDGCSSALPPDPATQAINAAKSWCAARGGLDLFSSKVPGQDASFVCIDKSACQQKPGKPMRCVTAQEKAAWESQRKAILQSELKNKLGDEILEINKRWSPQCPPDDPKCGMDIGSVAYQALKKVEAAAAANPTAIYALIKYFPLREANSQAQEVIREAEFRVLPKKWAADFNKRFIDQCKGDKQCVDKLTAIRTLTLISVNAGHKTNSAAQHSAMSPIYAEGEQAAIDFFNNEFAAPKKDKTTLRKSDIIAAYQTTMGRNPTRDEMNYWMPRSENAQQMKDAARNWIWSSAGAKDLRETVDRAAQQAFKKKYADAEINYLIEGAKSKKMVYDEMVKWLTPSKKN